MEIDQLPAHQQRVLKEHQELNDKIVLLQNFVESEKYEEICDDHFEMLSMINQLDIMKKYSNILQDRINRFARLNSKKNLGGAISTTKKNAILDQL